METDKNMFNSKDQRIEVAKILKIVDGDMKTGGVLIVGTNGKEMFINNGAKKIYVFHVNENYSQIKENCLALNLSKVYYSLINIDEHDIEYYTIGKRDDRDNFLYKFKFENYFKRLEITDCYGNKSSLFNSIMISSYEFKEDNLSIFTKKEGKKGYIFHTNVEPFVISLSSFEDFKIISILLEHNKEKSSL